jgi:tyrosinase
MNATEVPGAKSRYDDFLTVHINMTQHVHMSAYFLPWHRGFLRLYELALQNECGYSGTQPYWNWPLYASNLKGSPIFDGSEYSLSGDGAVVANEANITLGPGVVLPHGSGGGCVTSGPFVDYTVSMGPFEFAQALTGVLPTNAFTYNPRCLSRDLNTYIAETYTSQSDVDSLIFGSSTIAEFQDTMSGIPGTYAMGVHGGGHFVMGAIGSDMFASPGDPVFYLHHGMIDRVWTIWQALDPVNRQYAISGTGTFLNSPPSPNVTLTDTLSWGILGPSMPVESAMSVFAGPFCYQYI